MPPAEGPGLLYAYALRAGADEVIRQALEVGADPLRLRSSDPYRRDLDLTNLRGASSLGLGGQDAALPGFAEGCLRGGIIFAQKA